jgi:hypothetical protein
MRRDDGNLQSLTGGLKVKVRIQHPVFMSGLTAASLIGTSATGTTFCNRTAPQSS